MTTSTVTPSFTKAILQVLPELGIQLPPALLRDIRQQLQQQRLPISLQDQLWQQIEQQANGPDIGLAIGMAMQPANYDLVGFLLLSSTTMAQAAESLVSYSPLIGEGGVFSTKTVAGHWRLYYQPRFAVGRHIRLEAIIAGIVNGAKWLTGNDIQPLMVSFEHGLQGALDTYASIFGDARLSFEQDSNFVAFSNHDWHKPLTGASPEVQQLMQALAQQQLQQMQPQNMLARVMLLLSKEPGLNRAQAADKLALSERHLNRKLSEFGCSFRQLSDQARKEKVMELISHKGTTQADIAQQLGYADESAFSKAFRRWMGMGLRDYRRQLQQGASIQYRP